MATNESRNVSASTPSYRTALRETFGEMFSLDRECCPLTVSAMESFLKMRMSNLRKTTEVSQALLRSAIQIGSSVEGTATSHWLSKKAISLEVDVMYDVGCIYPEKVSSVLEPIPGSVESFHLLYVHGLENDLEPAFVDTLQRKGRKLKSPGTAYIDASALRELLVEIVQFEGKNEATRSHDFFGVNVLKASRNASDNGLSTCLSIGLETFGVAAAEMSIDNFICFRLSRWPDIAHSWITRSPRQWPNDKLIQDVVRRGCHIVPKPVVHQAQTVQTGSPSNHSDQNGAPCEWRYSFSLAEKTLAKHRTIQQQECYFIFKSLFYAYLQPLKQEEQSLPGYVIKTVMMWAMEELEPQQWQDELLADNVKYLLTKLESSLRKRFLMHYFIMEINLLDSLPQALLTDVADVTHKILLEPMTYLPEEARKMASKASALPHCLRGLVGFLEFRTMMLNTKM